MADEPAPTALSDAQMDALRSVYDEWCSVVEQISAPWRERAEAAEAKLDEARTLAADWVSTSEPAGDWQPTETCAVMGNCGRAILAILGTEGSDGNG